MGVQGFDPTKFWTFYVHNGAKLHFFDYKQTAILVQTFGHEMVL